MQPGSKSDHVSFNCLASCCISSLLLWAPPADPTSTWTLDWLFSSMRLKELPVGMLLTAWTLPVSAKLPGCFIQMSPQACWITSLCFKGNEHPLQNLLGFGNRSIPKTWRKIFTKVNSTMHTECTPCKHHVLFSLWGHPAIGLLGIWSNTILKINKISFLRQEMLFSRERVDIKFIPGQ